MTTVACRDAYNTDPGTNYRLTVKEHECAVLVGMAFNNPAIARQMFITTKSVENLINRIFRKLGYQNQPLLHPRVRLALWVLRNPVNRDCGSSWESEIALN